MLMAPFIWLRGPGLALAVPAALSQHPWCQTIVCSANVVWESEGLNIEDRIPETWGFQVNSAWAQGAWPPSCERGSGFHKSMQSQGHHPLRQVGSTEDSISSQYLSWFQEMQSVLGSTQSFQALRLP